jgi:DNA integrity scanning protein DisA with diadenylate cyclase activity
MASVIDKELIQYFIKLDDSQKKSLLEMIKSFLKSSDDNLERVTLEQYNSDLDEAMNRINIGEFTTFEDLEKEMQLW